jgi:hypothetical protein
MIDRLMTLSDGREVNVSATICSAEPDVGFMSDYLDDLVITDPDTDEEIEVDEQEEQRIVAEFLEAREP